VAKSVATTLSDNCNRLAVGGAARVLPEALIEKL
jgi:hypothetical protein